MKRSTSRPDYFETQTNLFSRKWLDENGHDVAPVYTDDDPAGFIHKDDLTTDDEGDTIDDHLAPLTIDCMIGGDTSFTAALSALIEHLIYTDRRNG